jgi:hypothetical protein
VAPVTVSDLTAPAVLGLEPRSYRELLMREAVPHARLGHRVVARVEDVLEALDRIAGRGGEAVAEPSGTDRILARIGRTRR